MRKLFLPIVGLSLFAITISAPACACGPVVELGWRSFFVIFALSYLIGSIPFGLIISRIAGLGDVRNIGSGNIGATNVLRTGSKWAAAATLLLDMMKGFIPLALFYTFAGKHSVLMGAAMIGVILGHCFPIWLKFKGGKGVATYIGAMLGLGGIIGITAGMIWLITARLHKISSLAALIMVSTMPFIAAILGFGIYVFAVMLMASAIIIYQHRENIGRLRKGAEPMIGKKK